MLKLYSVPPFRGSQPNRWCCKVKLSKGWKVVKLRLPVVNADGKSTRREARRRANALEAAIADRDLSSLKWIGSRARVTIISLLPKSDRKPKKGS
jgi:hypothetical protein